MAAIISAISTISYLSDVHFGVGAIRKLPELLTQLGIKRPLVVTDRGLVRLGLLERIGLRERVFDEVEPNPTEASALAGVARYRAEDCDGIIAFGGGSPIDLAKMVGLLVHHPLPLATYAIRNGGVAKITAQMPPLIAIPTTAGSGSEVGRAALLTLSSGDKLGFLSKHFLPAAVICDPELTKLMPPSLTAGSGMDAIAHCIEAFLSPRFNPVADAIALDGLERGYRAIRIACQDGSNLEARGDMMLCSLQGGLAFQKGLGAVHSLSHPLGALSARQLHHGTLNAIFLPPVLRFNHRACGERYAAIAARLGFANADAVPTELARLNRDLGMPAGLAALGLTAADLAPLAEKAYADHCTATNPRGLTVADLAQLYHEAL